MTRVLARRSRNNSSSAVPVNLLARETTVGSPCCGAISGKAGEGPVGPGVDEYTTGTLAARAFCNRAAMAGTVAVQAGLGWHTAPLISRISNVVVAASRLTGAGAGMAGIILGTVLAATGAESLIGAVAQAASVNNTEAASAGRRYFVGMAMTPEGESVSGR